MKYNIYTCLFFSLCFTQGFSQELPEFQFILNDSITIEQQNVDAIHTVETEDSAVSVLTIADDAFTLQVFNYTINELSFGVNTRLEEELPYNTNSYDYEGFYYLDFSCSYNTGPFKIGLSIENLLYLNSKDFSIDPNLEIVNGIINSFYLSHESDALVALTVTYNF